MKKFLLLLPLLSAFALPTSVEANWFDSRKNLFGKYRSKSDAWIACFEWSQKDQKNYFYAKDSEDSRIGKIYENPEAAELFPINGILNSSDRFSVNYFPFRSDCHHEEETRQMLGKGWKRNLNKNKIYSIAELRKAWGKYHYFKY